MSPVMLDSCSIDEPQTLFELPRLADLESGCITVGPVTGLSATKKRKRTQVVVGVDGEALNVYDLERSKLLVSHALPPQLYLTTDPCCITSRISKENQQRFTYAATRNELGASKHQVLCFKQELHSRKQEASFTSTPSSKTTYDLGTSDNPVVHIDFLKKPAVPEENQSLHDMICIRKNGHLSCLSADLQEELFTATISQPQIETNGTKTTHPFVILHASLAEPDHLVNWLSRSRPDVVAQLLPSSIDSQSTTHSTVICIVTYTASTTNTAPIHNFQLYNLRPKSSMPTQRSFIQLLATWELPIKTDIASPIQYTTDMINGRVYSHAAAGGSMTVIDLSKTTPKTLSRLEGPQAASSSARISSGLSFISSGSHLQIFDIRYGTIQASLDISAISNSSRKRKRSNNEIAKEYISISQYFPSLNLIVGTCGHKLVGCNVRIPPSIAKNKRGVETRLIDSLNKATDNNQAVMGDIASSKEKSWTKSMNEMNNAAVERQVDVFERIFFKSIDSLMTETSGQETYTAPVRMRKLQAHATYALSKIFILNSSKTMTSSVTQSRLRVLFMPSQVFVWLAENNFLKPEKLSTALGGNYSARLSMPLEMEDIVRAFVDFDHTATLLAGYMIHTNPNDAFANTLAMNFLLQSMESYQINKPENRITEDGKEVQDLLDEQLLHETEAAGRELDIAEHLLGEGTDTRIMALQRCLTKLAIAFAPLQVVQALKRHMSGSTLLSLIDILRSELMDGGWISKSLDFHPAYETQEGQSESISAISTLLSCCVDALGSGEWLADSSGDNDSTTTIISLLRAETSAVLEGVQESSFFNGFLKDFFRYEAARKKIHRRKAPSKDLVTVYEEKDSILPLGLKSTEVVSKTRTDAGGEIAARSARDIAYSYRKMVGTYTFERIDI